MRWKVVGLFFAGAFSLPAPAQVTAGERFRIYVRSTVGLPSMLSVGASAGIEQWRAAPSEWGQGLAGYGRQFGYRFAQHAVSETIQFGAGALLGEDPRYFRSHEKGFWPRTEYAIVHTFVVAREDGKPTFAVSRIAAAYGSGFIANTWFPAGYNGISDGVLRGTYAITSDMANNVFREFWPDIKRKLRRRHH